jgi:hypothetical protein
MYGWSMNVRRTLLAALALVAVASFVQSAVVLDVATVGISFLGDVADVVDEVVDVMEDWYTVITVGTVGF